ncbi:MAG: S9 family peptidase [Candidatus Poribacteria bacterium]|nr:S9 family peptidase [Candidatus Poribacteria bacterium]MDE0506896.1 S9 family peptidase [Candidatus Poribacteria bacterium]
MAEPENSPFGSWKSPITSDLIVSQTVRFAEIATDGEDTYWIEMRPEEEGRCVIVRRTSDGNTVDMTPAPFNVRSRVHEYGGGAFTVNDGIIYFSSFEDQRIYRQSGESSPQPITPSGEMRYADAVIDNRGENLICVCENHSLPNREPDNTIVSVGLKDKQDDETLVSGADFYSSPRLSPDGSRLAWISWNHPNMPWDGTVLWCAKFKEDGTLTESCRISGGTDVSTLQPEWSPDGVLHFISDEEGWWNLYRWSEGRVEPLYSTDAEFAMPHWEFGLRTFGFESARSIICIYSRRGNWELGRLDAETHRLDPIATPYTDMSRIGLRVAAGRVVFGAGSPTEMRSIVALNLVTHEFEVLRRMSAPHIDTRYLSVPETIEFPTKDGMTAHAFFYPPQNDDYAAPSGERPPVLVQSHGGPTGATSSTLDLTTQYWTTRGFAVLDVNYGGSTGYGRAYRERLDGNWGVVDVDDCIAGVQYLINLGIVDACRVAISGGSAGGYTTLCALTFHDMFKAGASYYGISDLEALAKDTHKFESRYLDKLVGPYPDRCDLYRERSPIHFTNRLSCPVILFQGLDDKIVPPNQAQMMVAALREKGLPVAYVAFEGEQHGFRRAENIKRCLTAELYFYSRIFGFTLSDPVEPLLIENLDN